MEIEITGEHGYSQAMEGLSFSYQTEAPLKELKREYLKHTTACTLASKDGGHNKFLESIMVWFNMRAPLYFWSQFDTYRAGITKNSKSKMHTIMKRPLLYSDFEKELADETLNALNDLIYMEDFDLLIHDLPEGFLQTRQVCCSYKVIRGIIKQRQNHKLKEWKYFCDYMKNNLMYPELLGKDIHAA